MEITDSFRIDMYGNINMISDEKYHDQYKMSGGFQSRYQINDNMTITGQMHIREGLNGHGRPSNSLEDYDTELKWLYLDYSFENDITLRVGAFQFPVFKASETGDIEYTYTWTNEPLRTYGVFGAEDFEGAEVLKKFSYEDYDFIAQLSVGESKTRLADGRGNSGSGDINSLIGLTLKTSHESFILNLGYLQAKADLASARKPVEIDSNVSFNMYALESEIYMNNFTLKSGLIKSNLTNVFPEDLNYYTSLEYSYKDFTPYILFSKETIYLKAFQIRNKKIVKSSKTYKDKYSIGTRYDISDNVALKLSYTYEKTNLAFPNISTRNLTNNTVLGTISFVF